MFYESYVIVIINPIYFLLIAINQDTYHFIRVWDSSEQGRFIDFLRENATGYVLAWRVFATLAQAGAARLCYFTDEKAIALKLADLFMFDITNQHSSYSVA